MTTTIARHRRELPAYIDLTVADVQNWARCQHFGWSKCSASMCPRHQPTAYADHLARHATDSI